VPSFSNVNELSMFYKGTCITDLHFLNLVTRFFPLKFRNFNEHDNGEMLFKPSTGHIVECDAAVLYLA
jgi:hypothetical protein